MSERRPVSMLTPTQLALKRAKDSAAQRALRNRRKLQIEQLENELSELRSCINDKDELLRRNRQLEAELLQYRTDLLQSRSSLNSPQCPKDITSSNHGYELAFCSLDESLLIPRVQSTSVQSVHMPMDWVMIPPEPGQSQTVIAPNQELLIDESRFFTSWDID